MSIHVHHLSQMFNSLDPSPFWDRDLDREAAAFVEDEFSDRRSARDWHLHVYTQQNLEIASDLQVAVENYYARLAASTRRKLRDQFRFTQWALASGIGIFAICMTARGILSGVFHGAAPRLLDEGLIILAWLALWRPAEALLYGWVPLYRERKLYERLAAIRVSVFAESEHAATIPQPAQSDTTSTPSTRVGQ